MARQAELSVALHVPLEAELDELEVVLADTAEEEELVPDAQRTRKLRATIVKRDLICCACYILIYYYKLQINLA